MDHAGALAHAPEMHLCASDGDRGAGSLWHRIRRHDTAGSRLSAFRQRLERVLRFGNAGVDLVDWQRHTDHAGGSDDRVLLRNGKGFSQGFRDRFSIGDALLAHRCIGHAAVHDDRLRLALLSEVGLRHHQRCCLEKIVRINSCGSCRHLRNDDSQIVLRFFDAAVEAAGLVTLWKFIHHSSPYFISIMGRAGTVPVPVTLGTQT